MHFEFLHPADMLVMFMQRVYEYGMTTTSGGNLSIRDKNGDVWITPSGIDKGSLTRRDIMQIKPDGTVIGIHTPSVELPFHLDIYRRRPDISAILHAHPPIPVAFSLARKVPDGRLVPDLEKVCGKIAMAEYAVPGSAQLGANIAKYFEAGYNAVMLENHGCVVGAPDMFSAFKVFETLDTTSRLEVNAARVGKIRHLTDEQVARANAITWPAVEEFASEAPSSEECTVRADMCRFASRCYDQGLFSSTQGTIAQRLSDGSLVVTPYNVDRKYLDEKDPVLIKGGKREQGKRPTRALALVSEILARHPEFGCVMLAHCPAIMAFAVTDQVFDSRLIPESYIQLRDVKRMPFLATTEDVTGIADTISEKQPVIIVDNDCVIVAGKTMLNAFDRLEVLDYSAKAIIAARDIAPLVKISDEQIDEIETAFNLK